MTLSDANLSVSPLNSDTPMDLFEASLIVAADALNQRVVFTLDSDFNVYRLEDGSALEVVPQGFVRRTRINQLP